MSRLVRRGDPRTSVEAARKAAKASMRALRAVEALMKDGTERIDYEIWQGCREQGYLKKMVIDLEFSLNRVGLGRVPVRIVRRLDHDH